MGNIRATPDILTCCFCGPLRPVLRVQPTLPFPVGGNPAGRHVTASPVPMLRNHQKAIIERTFSHRGSFCCIYYAFTPGYGSARRLMWCEGPPGALMAAAPLPSVWRSSLLASAGDDGTVRLWRANFLNVWHPVSVVTPGGSVAPESGLPIPPPLFAAAVSEQSQRDSSLLGVSRGIPLNGSSSVKAVSSETSVSTIGSGIQAGMSFTLSSFLPFFYSYLCRASPFWILQHDKECPGRVLVWILTDC
ncbi:unnamed protein product [Schistocephalus solidus]|uniref:WD_REPEATS_REGION domain-containing protein n=1 Tax=Schistocephalus solidus TaxID=70667 RepID=A0A183SVW0_SCHSO|nr:unnamed protein product [Schistocephalus solidus]